MERAHLQHRFEEALLQYDKAMVTRIFHEYLSQHSSMEFIDNIIVESLLSIGEKWEKGNAALSQVYMSSKICEELVDKLLPVDGVQIPKDIRLAIVTLEDYHALGKRIVGSMLKSVGYPLLDYGCGMTAEAVIRKASDDRLQVLLISVLMYPSALKIRQIAAALHRLNPPVKILVGGAPFLIDDRLGADVGADAVGKNAADDIRILELWVKEGLGNAG